MNDFNARQLLIELFLRLKRQSGMSPGIGELLAALRAVEGGFGTASQDELKEVVRLLWCSSLPEARELEAIWPEIISPMPTPPRVDVESTAVTPSSEADRAGMLSTPDTPSPISTAGVQELMPSSSLSTLPVKAPFLPVPDSDSSDLAAYWPVSRRALVYAWRYLRRPMADGPRNLLDVTATVERTARQGFYIGPAYRCRERNHAHLVLLLDQGGSMVPFHRFTRDIVETTQEVIGKEQVDVFYFHNSVNNTVYADAHLIRPVPFEQMRARCLPDTSLLIVSDAGAARGDQRFERLRATTTMLLRIKRHTTLLAWLNPMPQGRWENTSAQRIAHLLPMFQMDLDGLSSAIDVVRGQPLHSVRKATQG